MFVQSWFFEGEFTVEVVIDTNSSLAFSWKRPLVDLYSLSGIPLQMNLAEIASFDGDSFLISLNIKLLTSVDPRGTLGV